VGLAGYPHSVVSYRSSWTNGEQRLERRSLWHCVGKDIYRYSRGSAGVHTSHLVRDVGNVFVIVDFPRRLRVQEPGAERERKRVL
jgi:hypothetical protein